MSEKERYTQVLVGRSCWFAGCIYSNEDETDRSNKKNVGMWVGRLADCKVYIRSTQVDRKEAYLDCILSLRVAKCCTYIYNIPTAGKHNTMSFFP